MLSPLTPHRCCPPLRPIECDWTHKECYVEALRLKGNNALVVECAPHHAVGYSVTGMGSSTEMMPRVDDASRCLRIRLLDRTNNFFR